MSDQETDRKDSRVGKTQGPEMKQSEMRNNECNINTYINLKDTTLKHQSDTKCNIPTFFPSIDCLLHPDLSHQANVNLPCVSVSAFPFSSLCHCVSLLFLYFSIFALGVVLVFSLSDSNLPLSTALPINTLNLFHL